MGRRGGEGGIRTHGGISHSRFPGVRLKPLSHLSTGARTVRNVPGRRNWILPDEMIAGYAPIAQPAVAAPILDADTTLPVATAASRTQPTEPAAVEPANAQPASAAPQRGDQSG